MAHVVSVGTALPPFRLSKADARSTVERLFSGSFEHLDRLLTIFDNSGIEERYSCVPIDWFQSKHSVEEKHLLYARHAVDLAEQAIVRCLHEAETDASTIDQLVFVSTTGTVTPSIDAYLTNRLPFRRNIKRTPVWGLGCAGGAAGLSRAYEYVTAFPRSCCLVVSVELCGLTFIADDKSKSNLVATSLFADGAAAALVCGDEWERARGPKIAATQSTIWPDTLDVMGWDVTNDGLKVIFSRDIPTLIHQEMKSNVESLLQERHLSLAQLDTYVLHPGGMKVLKAYEEALGLSPDKLGYARSVLRRYGNMSSATVLFVLKEAMESAGTSGYGLAGALGPGFSSELLLLDWTS
ncbi:type III polyketide synthase [Paenibacillus thalictri]|uniref:Type III polyketide synthase n=2 Tax=Paenibacillus thalictri TaxID=2527873 RepID=A0A4Q9DXJ1_9BACL|nr:3-oxoacyl-[acyl-carrier-protein] synthase III C-terminal domain-containing protein [Paenibacillus thalictri]TBL80497.1 type III polyketide synthase [Paenibacillus thalictri]